VVSDRSASWYDREGDCQYKLREYASAPLSGRVASLDDQAELGEKEGQGCGDMGRWSTGPRYPCKVDRSANNGTRRREQRAGKTTEATAGWASSSVCGM
jgi:hypothetical protein